MYRQNTLFSGYLEVKISSKSKRGLVPWKAWQKQWCELRSLDDIDNGLEVKLKSSPEGSVVNCVKIPRSSIICRTESSTKNYAFGIFKVGATQQPLLFLAGTSESNVQDWMLTIRKMLSVATYLPIGETNFHVSIVDNTFSRTAGLLGLHGVLGLSSQAIIISDPCTGVLKKNWSWHQFHQFHFQASSQPIDEERVIVMHTSMEFPHGPGQIYLYCVRGSTLLELLINKGKCQKSHIVKSLKRLSRSEGDLCSSYHNDVMSCLDSPNYIQSQTDSDDSGVRGSMSSDDLTDLLNKPVSAASVEFGILAKTPGGSLQDLVKVEVENPSNQSTIPRRESGISVASGIYEEISETTPPKINHIYENPIDLIPDECKKQFKPPPLPPRTFDFTLSLRARKNNMNQYKQRCNTLPAKDLSRISKTFTSDSEYVVMSPSKTSEPKSEPKFNPASISDSLYLPMSSVIHLKNKLENCYMIMRGKN